MKSRSGWWMEFFKSLVEQEIFNPGDEIQMARLWPCFAQLLQSERTFEYSLGMQA